MPSTFSFEEATAPEEFSYEDAVAESREEKGVRLRKELEDVRGQNRVARFVGGGPVVSRAPDSPEMAAALVSPVGMSLRPIRLPPRSVLEPAARAGKAAAETVEESVYGMTDPTMAPLIPLAAIPSVASAMGIYFGGQAAGAGAGELSVGIERGEPETIGRGVGQIAFGAPLVHAGVTPAVPVRLPLSMRAAEEVVRGVEVPQFIQAKVQPGERAGIPIPSIGERMSKPGLATQPKPPAPSVPGTPAEVRESAVETVRRAKAQTIRQIQELFPKAQLSREQAREIRDAAFPPVEAAPEPVRPAATVEDVLGIKSTEGGERAIPITETKEVLRDVQEQPAVGTGEVPAETGVEGISRSEQAKEATPASEVPLTPEERAAAQTQLEAEVPAAQSDTPEPAPVAAEKAQAEVTRVAQTEGKRSAKEIKDELVEKLTKAWAEAPDEFDPAIPTVKISIPGDGEFTLSNTTGAIESVLKRAKRIQTDTEVKAFFPKGAIESSAKAISIGAREAPPKPEPVSAETIKPTAEALNPPELLSPREYLAQAGEVEPMAALRQHYAEIQRAYRERKPINAEAADKYEPDIPGSTQTLGQWLMERGYQREGDRYVHDPESDLTPAQMRRIAQEMLPKPKEAPPALFVKHGNQLRQVTPEQASLAMGRIRESSGAGASELGPMPLYDEIGKQIGRVSYNGRVWLGTGKNERVIFEPGTSAIDPKAEVAKASELRIDPIGLTEAESTPLALGRIRKSDPKRYADIQRFFGTKEPGKIAKAAKERLDQLRAARETPVVPPPPMPPEPPAGPVGGGPLGPGPEVMGAFFGGFGGRRFGLDMTHLWDDLKALWMRRPAKRDMAQLADAMIDTIPANKGREAGNELRTMTRQRTRGRLEDNKLARKAVVFVIQAKGNPAKLVTDLVKVAGNSDAAGAIRYAQANWDALQPLAARTKLLLDEQIGYERANGINTEYEDHYVPQRHENIFTDRGVLFGETRPNISTAFKKAKVFPDYASAIEAGYVPRNLDIADLIEHRVRTGQRLVNRKMWAEGFKTVMDPFSGESIMADMVARRIPRPNGTVDVQWSAPAGYVPKEIIPGVRIAVRQGYSHLFNALTGTSQIREAAPGRAALNTAGWLKHQLLLLDTFHASRTMQTSLAARGSASYDKGLSLLEYSDRALNEAVANNLVTSEMAAWIRTPQPFEVGGTTVHMTPREVAQLGMRNGLNVGRFADALYDQTKGIVGTNRFTKWLFEKLTRGAMVETFMSEFARVGKANPAMTREAVAKQVARDINVLFGNLQRQSFIKNPAIRDLMQIAFLAPQWVESLARRELRAAGQMASSAVRLARGEGVHFGTVAKTVGTGLAAYVALTQLLNYAFRGHSTMQNDEEGHKLDAWIPDPTGESDGFWFSPLSVFGEITHDVLRYSHSEPSEAHAFGRIASNKLGPLGRALSVLATGRDYSGTELPGTWERVKEAGMQLAPVPIGVAPVVKAQLPGGQKPPPGAVTRQIAGSLGFKIEPKKENEQQIARARELNIWIDYWKHKARQLPIEDRRAYIESEMSRANLNPSERHKVKREIGEAGVLKYR